MEIAEKKKQAIEDAVEVVLGCEQAECPVTHTFGPGTYTRELRMKAGTFIIGHCHTHEHLNIFVQGKIAMMSDDGSVQEMSAPMTFIGKPGHKVCLVLEDTIWINVHATDKTDVSEIEKDIYTKSDRVNQLLIDAGSTMLSYSNEHYKKTITDMGFTEEQVREISETDNLRELPFGTYKIEVSESNIQGKGLFATSSILQGEEIAPARIGDKRTIAGRYTNHSEFPNAEMVSKGPDVYLIAKTDIQGCKGGLDGDEITVDYGQSYKESMRSLQGV